MDTSTPVSDVTLAAPPESASITVERNELLVDELLVDELLVEEISIDGMCGVY